MYGKNLVQGKLLQNYLVDPVNYLVDPVNYLVDHVNYIVDHVKSQYIEKIEIFKKKIYKRINERVDS